MAVRRIYRKRDSLTKAVLLALELAVVSMGTYQMLSLMSSIAGRLAALWISGLLHSLLLLTMDITEELSSRRFEINKMLNGDDGAYLDLSLEVMPFIIGSTLTMIVSEYDTDSRFLHVSTDPVVLALLLAEALCAYQMCKHSKDDIDVTNLLGHYSMFRLITTNGELIAIMVSAVGALLYLCRLRYALCSSPDQNLLAMSMILGTATVTIMSPVLR